jgi:periplasmic protein TonB
MKKLFLLHVLCMSCFLLTGQNTPETTPKKEIEVETLKEYLELQPEQVATFQDGTRSLYSFIAENMKYPESAIDHNLQGKCYISFVVEKDGTLSDIKVKKGVPGCPECDEEALRITRMIPNWNPAKVKGKPVRSVYLLPFAFMLQDDK